MEMILVRNISRNRESFAPSWGKALLVTCGGFIALFAVAMVFAYFVLSPGLRMLVPYIALSDGLFGKVTQLAGRAFQGAGQLGYTAKLTALTNAGRTAMAAALFFYARLSGHHPTAYTWTKIYWLSTLAIGIFAFALVTLRLGWPKLVRLSLHDVTEGFSFSLSTSSISVYNDIDKTFLVSAGQVYAAGIYTAAYRVIDVVTVPVYSIYAAATPRMFREGASGVDQAKLLARRVLKKTLPYGIAASICVFFGAGLFPFIFGSSFSGSVAVLRWLCLLPLLRVLHYSWGTTITASASQWNRTVTQLGAAGLNLLLNAILIPRWSWHGAAIASLLTDGALAASNRIVLWRLERKDSVSRKPRPA
jgi:O-antigen/teichoic acid export membrane protein